MKKMKFAIFMFFLFLKNLVVCMEITDDFNNHKRLKIDKNFYPVGYMNEKKKCAAETVKLYLNGKNSKKEVKGLLCIFGECKKKEGGGTRIDFAKSWNMHVKKRHSHRASHPTFFSICEYCDTIVRDPKNMVRHFGSCIVLTEKKARRSFIHPENSDESYSSDNEHYDYCSIKNNDDSNGDYRVKLKNEEENGPNEEKIYHTENDYCVEEESCEKGDEEEYEEDVKEESRYCSICKYRIEADSNFIGSSILCSECYHVLKNLKKKLFREDDVKILNKAVKNINEINVLRDISRCLLSCIRSKFISKKNVGKNKKSKNNKKQLVVGRSNNVDQNETENKKNSKIFIKEEEGNEEYTIL
jgi:hypothetical protein